MSVASLAFLARGIFFLLVFAMACTGAAMNVTFDVQPRLMNLGETATATLTFHDTHSAPSIEFPPIPGLQITGTGQQRQFGTGGSRVSLTYNLFPQKPGSYTIGPYNLDFSGETIVIPAVSLEVRAPNAQSEGSTAEMVFGRITLPEKSPTIHQVFDIVLSVYSLPNIELTRDVNLLGGFPESGFVIGTFEELQTIREEVNGQLYNLRRFRARARALTVGTFALQPALRVGVVDANQRRRQDPFFDNPFFGGGPSATPVNVAIPPANLTVRAIPDDNRPDNFNGAVGQFDFAMDVRPSDLKVGEPITVSVRVQGTGNIATVLPPSYQDADLFKAYEARQVGETPDPAAERGTKTFEQVVIPRTDALKELPTLIFSFFDPESSTYRTVSAGPFPIVVHPSENGSNALLLQVPGNASAGGHSLVLGSDIIYLKPVPSHWIHTENSGRHQKFLLGIHAASPLALAGLFFATRRRNRLASDIALARRQKAPRSARANLQKAETALRQTPSAAAVFSSLAAAVSDYFGHRLNLPPGAVEDSLILDKLRAAKVDPHTLNQWQDFFSLSNQVRYSSSSDLSLEALEKWISTVSTLLRKAERVRL